MENDGGGGRSGRAGSATAHAARDRLQDQPAGENLAPRASSRAPTASDGEPDAAPLATRRLVGEPPTAAVYVSMPEVTLPTARRAWPAPTRQIGG